MLIPGWSQNVEGSRRSGVWCQQRGGSLPIPNPSDLSLSISLQRIVCTAGLKWYPHPAVIHCVKGCEVSHKDRLTQIPRNSSNVILIIFVITTI
jgi:hypothetical protein